MYEPVCKGYKDVRESTKEALLAAKVGSSLLRAGREVCGDWAIASQREWLVTNGIGGFACGTLANANTRRYHGLLIASAHPPVERIMLVSKLDIAALYLNRRYDFSANEFADGTVSPRGFELTESFELLDGIPTWQHTCADAVLQQQIFMAPGANTTYLALTVTRASAPLQLELTPLCGHRDYHAQQRGVQPMTMTSSMDGCTLNAEASVLSCHLSISEGRFEADADWYWNFAHRAEAERGLDVIEDLFVPGRFRATLQPGQTLFFVASARDDPPAPGEQVLSAVIDKARWLKGLVPADAPEWIAQLALASDQFIVQRPAIAGAVAGSRNGVSVIAGYPWFTDWSRDTLISLPGLTLSLGRREIAASILDTLLTYLDAGMLPNRFSDTGEHLEYNTADATLWLFNAVDEYLNVTADMAWARQVFPLLLQILRAHLAGTRFGIQVDADDGLLRAGVAGAQVTWMDAKVGDWVVTPRIGKPVEINALWLNALDVSLRLAIRLRDSESQMLCKAWLGRARNGFARFWNDAAGCLHDVLDVEGTSATDSSMRPNQILAVSLPYCALPAHQMRAVVDSCAHQLLTGTGLRSLSAASSQYRPHYGGDPHSRDGAYHQGTVWTWLLGPFAWAHYRVYGDAAISQSFLEPLGLELRRACFGTLSEISDGEPPHAPRGCFAQAWSVAETLRVWLRLEREKSKNGKTT